MWLTAYPGQIKLSVWHMMKSLFHLIEHLMSMDEFKLLIEILFFKAFLINIHSNGERNTLHLYIHKLLKERSK